MEEVYEVKNSVLNKEKQKGFTFVELLVIMIVISILSGIGIKFVLSSQENKARLTNAKIFLGKDMPVAIYSCLLRRDSLSDCSSAATLSIENIDIKTEWDQTWVVGGVREYNSSSASLSIAVCYPIDNVGTDEEDRSVGDGLKVYLEGVNTAVETEVEYSIAANGVVGGLTTTCGVKSVITLYTIRGI